MIHLPQPSFISAAIRSGLREAGVEVGEFSTDPDGKPGEWLIAALDNARLDRLRDWERIAHNRSMRLFPVHLQNGEAVIGPATLPGREVCLGCWEMRFFRGRGKAREYSNLAIQCDDMQADGLLTPSSVAVIARIATERFLRIFLADDAIAGGKSSIYYFDLRSFTGREWRFVADPTCKECGALPPDSPQRAEMNLSPRLKPTPHSDRVRPLKELAFVEEAFIGHFSNIVSNRKYRWPDHREAVTTVGVGLRESRRIEPCHGFCTRYSDADLVAVLESVERYCGTEPRAFKPSVFGSYSQLGEAAVNPRSFGLHSEREYRANPQLTPYSDDLQFEHVWAYSLRDSKPKLVPRELGFYTLGLLPVPGRFIAIEGSNGCSIGNSIEEAILHGIFEVAERDAYMLAWYGSLKLASIDPMTSEDTECRHWCRRLRADGFEISVVDATSDFGIPAMLIVAVRQNRWPYIVCASSAHLYPEVTLKKLLRELYATIGLFEASGEERRERAFKLAKDFSQVSELIDHSVAHSTLNSLEHLNFLRSSDACISMQEMKSRVAEMYSPDLTVELRRVVDKILATGCDVLVVNQTVPEQREYGLHTVKVLIPGAIPPCWGDHRRRFEHLPRLDAAVAHSRPGVNGDKPLPNLVPHPFI